MKFTILPLTLSMCAPLVAFNGEKAELIGGLGTTISVMKKIYTSKANKPLLVQLIDERCAVNDWGHVNATIRPINSKFAGHNFHEWTHDGHYYQEHFDFTYTRHLPAQIAPANIAQTLSIPTVTDTVLSQKPEDALVCWKPYTPHTEMTTGKERCLIVSNTSDRDNTLLDQWFELQKTNLQKAMRRGYRYRETTYVNGKPVSARERYAGYKEWHTIPYVDGKPVEIKIKQNGWFTRNYLFATIAGLGILSASFFAYKHVFGD